MSGYRDQASASSSGVASVRRGRVPVVVVGGGVVGCAILREFARHGVAGLLLEAEADLGEGTSKANSAIVHTGFDAKPGTVEATMLRRAAALWPATLEDLSVPFLPVGALMLARTPGEVGRRAGPVATNAAALGVETEWLDAPALHELAPYLAPGVLAGLSVPGEGVIDPFWLTRAYAEAAMAAGSEVRLRSPVVGLRVGAAAVTVHLADGTSVRTQQVVLAAGLRADELAGTAGDRSFAITPRKGQFLVSEETFGVNRIVLPIPGRMGKGMLVTPIVFGGLLLGPSAADGVDKDDRSTDPDVAARILAACSEMVPALAGAAPVREFAGLRPVSSTGDFILRPSTAGDRLYLAAGIRSTGISTSPAVAEAVVADVLTRRGWVGRGATGRVVAPAFELPAAAGEVVCLCRSIGHGEIEAACTGPTAPGTLDAIKRRGGAMFGDCQGNLCALAVARIVADVRGVPVEAVEKHRPGSWFAQRIAPAPAASHPKAPPVVQTGWNGVMARRVDLAVIGGGAAGQAAAAAARAAGATIAIIERRQGATAVGLVPLDDRWTVLVQAPSGASELAARGVLLATGGYTEPREHRPIAGPRPAGVMTADLAWELLEAGLRPGQAIALVGTGASAQRLAAAMETSGARVTPLSEPPTALRGDARVAGVLVAGVWHDVDALVLADRRLPQAFLLRGLGLVDARPGTPAPADLDGRLPVPGLWAAGCCVTARLDHEACAERGAAVGRLAAAELMSLRSKAALDATPR